MFGFGESTDNKKPQGRTPSQITPLPELKYFEEDFVKGISNNASLAAAFGDFVQKFTSQDPTVQNIKTVLRSLQDAFPELTNPSWNIKTLLEACIKTLAQSPPYAFPHTKITDENQEDLEKYSEILAILHYVLMTQIHVNMDNFLCWPARKVVDALLAVQRVAHELQKKPPIGSIEQELSGIAGLLTRWQDTLNINLFRHEQRKLLKDSELGLIQKISRLSLETEVDEIIELFSTIGDLKEQIAMNSDASESLKSIELNTFLITVLAPLLEKYKALALANNSVFAEGLKELMKSINESNIALNESINKITKNDEDDGLCDEDEEFFQTYTQYFRWFLDTKLISEENLELGLPDSSNISPAQLLSSPRYDTFYDADDEIMILETPVITPTPTPTPTPTTAANTAATARPFLNARRMGEATASSLCMLYAGGVGLEALGHISLVSVIEPFFVAATFASPAAIIALAACAVVLLIAMAEMAYTYYENTQAARMKAG